MKKNTKVAKLVKQLRKQLGVTQKELAKRLSVKPNTVAMWERGEQGMHPLRQAQIAEMLDYTNMLDYSNFKNR